MYVARGSFIVIDYVSHTVECNVYLLWKMYCMSVYLICLEKSVVLWAALMNHK